MLNLSLAILLSFSCEDDLAAGLATLVHLLEDGIDAWLHRVDFGAILHGQCDIQVVQLSDHFHFACFEDLYRRFPIHFAGMGSRGGQNRDCGWSSLFSTATRER